MGLLLLSLSLLPMGAANATGNETELILGIVSTRTTGIYPLEPLERDIQSLYAVVYDSLIEIDDDYRPAGRLAESWIETNGGKTWTFTLRDNIYFSDGTPLTARDVAATAQYILNRVAQDQQEEGGSAQGPGYYRNLAYFVSSVSAPDARTVVFKTRRSYYGFLYALLFPILPADKLEWENPPGTGAYVITQFQPQELMWLEFNPLWWQTPPQIREIMAVFHLNNKELITAYEYSRVDALFTRNISASQYKTGITSVSLDYRSHQLEMLYINHTEQALKSVNVRKAVRHAINTDLIIKQVYLGMADRADTPVQPGTWLSKEYPGEYDYNPELAVRLLEEDGWYVYADDGVRERVVPGREKNQRLHIRLLVYEEPENDVRSATAALIADELEAIGFSVSIIMDTQADAAAKLKSRGYDLALCAVNMDPAQDPGFILMTNNTMNYMRYSNKAMDDAFNTLRGGSPDAAHYQQAMHHIQDIFTQDAPVITLYYRKGVVISRKMYTNARRIRELELLRGIDAYGR
ncbi:MAG: ABC transporter substrate-binding protein [Clostridia bacterium]|nr:ABC transporter substrate-binding protein [Clostridia bacterium]